MKKRYALALALFPALVAAAAPRPAIDTQQVKAVFQEAERLCTADAGKLWGVSLCRPLLFVDPGTREAVANQPVTGGTRDGSIYRFRLPASMPISDTPVTLDGHHWAEMMWPPPSDPDMRAVTLMHESFHTVQPKLHFITSSALGEDTDLATENGRIWFRGELHALRAALTSNGDARRHAVADAIVMRLYHQALFPQAARQEQQLDVLEGVAESTGISAGLPPAKRIGYVLKDIDLVENSASYVRDFPYATGPAYGELLDAVNPGWRKTISNDTDIALLTGRVYNVPLTTPTVMAATVAINRYGGKDIIAQERANAIRMATLKVKYTREFVNGRTLALPMHHSNVTFNPRAIESLAGHGTVYHTLQLSGPWGELDVNGGDALIDQSFSKAFVAAPTQTQGSIIHGDGWTLTLAPTYHITTAPAGSLTVGH